MEKELQLLQTIAPDIMDVVQERFTILRQIHWMAPVGRRTLAERLHMSERALRTETDLLRQLNLIDSSKSGMTLTKQGVDLVRELEDVMSQLSGMKKMEKELATLLNIEKVIIVAGDSDVDAKVFEKFGQVVTDSLKMLLPDRDNIIAVMGGTTMAAVANQMTPFSEHVQNNIFVPARGGIGEAVDIQANSVSEMMANRTGGTSRPLYVPERVSQETYNSLLQEPFVHQVLDLIKEATCVIHSIGRAMHMAKRRGMSAQELEMLKEKHAVSEAFGYFFNEKGEIVYKIPRIGLQLKELEEVPYVLAVTGGSRKAEAITSYMTHAPHQTWLITDEGAANQILKGVTL